MNKNKLIYIDFSNYEIVKALILGRKELEAKINSTNFGVNVSYEQELTLEDIVCIYASLDSLIEKCEFNSKRLELLELLFKGNSIVGVKEYVPRGTRGTRKLLDSIIKDINNMSNCVSEIGGE